jgi:hypothetical protein
MWTEVTIYLHVANNKPSGQKYQAYYATQIFICNRSLYSVCECHALSDHFLQFFTSLTPCRCVERHVIL